MLKNENEWADTAKALSGTSSTPPVGGGIFRASCRNVDTLQASRTAESVVNDAHTHPRIKKQ